jgi:hypothetical protein
MTEEESEKAGAEGPSMAKAASAETTPVRR